MEGQISESTIVAARSCVTCLGVPLAAMPPCLHFDVHTEVWSEFSGMSEERFDLCRLSFYFSFNNSKSFINNIDFNYSITVVDTLSPLNI